jgi:hypothetical protein
MANAKCSSEQHWGLAIGGMCRRCGWSPQSLVEYLQHIYASKSNATTARSASPYLPTTQAPPQAATSPTSTASSSATTPSSSAKFPSTPVEGQIEYMYGGPMGTGWYIYEGGGWRVYGGNDDDWFTHRQYGKCECGAEKAKQPGHSSWCPKHGG